MFQQNSITNKKLPLDRLSGFYGNIATMIHSGLSLEQVFLNFSKNENNSIHRQQFAIIANKLKVGQHFIDCLRQIQCLPEFDIPLLKAAVAMGRIPELAKKLSVQYDELHRAINEIKKQMFSPLFTMTVAVLAKDFAFLVSGQISTLQYFLRAVPLLLIIFGAAYALYWVWQQSQYLKIFRKYLYTSFAGVPGLDRFILSSSIQRFSLALELALETGMDMTQSLELAAESAGFERVSIAAKRMIPRINEGESLERALAAERVFPQEFIAAVDIGINSGKLPETIQQYRLRLEIEIAKMRGFVVAIIPRIIQIAVALYVAFMVLDFYGQSFKVLNSIE